MKDGHDPWNDRSRSSGIPTVTGLDISSSKKTIRTQLSTCPSVSNCDFPSSYLFEGYIPCLVCQTVSWRCPASYFNRSLSLQRPLETSIDLTHS
jgi:hypothetical protein